MPYTARKITHVCKYECSNPIKEIHASCHCLLPLLQGFPHHHTAVLTGTIHKTLTIFLHSYNLEELCPRICSGSRLHQCLEILLPFLDRFLQVRCQDFAVVILFGLGGWEQWTIAKERPMRAKRRRSTVRGNICKRSGFRGWILDNRKRDGGQG